MNIILLGAAGFIGTNLTLWLAKDKNNQLTLADVNDEYFDTIKSKDLSNIKIKKVEFSVEEDFKKLLKGQDIVYHLVSTTIPTTSNKRIPQELTANVIASARMLEACVTCKVKKVVFISSGGTVYGRNTDCPINESADTNPISSYGIQKITIEKLLYLYHYLYGIDYRIIRLANPYGPYQRPNGLLGAVTIFTYKALKGEEITVFGDGSVVRDYIYIDDVVRAISNIVDGESSYRIFNLGSGYGTSIQELIQTIHETLGIDMVIKYKPGRKVDVPVNYLDITRYEAEYGKLDPIPLREGVLKLAEFMRARYQL